MKASNSERAPFDPARLPEGLRARGRPLAVHRRWQDVIANARRRFLARAFGENWRDALRGPAIERSALFALGGLLFCGGLAALGIFFFRPPANEDPRWVLGAAVAMLVLGALGFGLGLFYHLLRDVGTRTAAHPGKPPDGPDFYLVYPDGLAAVSGDRFEFMAWGAVQEVSWVSVRLVRHLALTDKEGHQLLVLQHGYTEAGELRLAIFQRVNEVLLPKVLNRIAGGKTVKFGPFGLSRAGLKYKGRTAHWGEVTSLKLQTRGETRLTIYVRGRPFAWCWCNVNTIPNWHTFYDALCRTAPDRLLTTATRPRW